MECSKRRNNRSIHYILNTTGAGTATIRATILDGIASGENFTKDFSVSVTTQHIPVTNIENIPSSIGATPTGWGGYLYPYVVPDNATFKTIVWSVVDAGTTGVTITNNTFISAQHLGTAIIKATIANGTAVGVDYTQIFTINVITVPVTNIIISSSYTWAGTPLELAGTIEPEYATYQNIVWSVKSQGTTGCTINGKIFNATTSGTAKVTATIVNGIAPGQNFTKDFDIYVEKAQLSGNVTISGSAVFGQTLTAITTGLKPSSIPLGTLTYKWKRGTTNIGTNASTYTLVQADIGNKITVTVTAANCTGEVSSPSTATVTKAKQTAPAAPTLNSKTTTSITLKTVSGCEYRRDNGNWQTSPIFSGLSPNSTYSFTQRNAETATHSASLSSTAASFKTNEEVGIDEISETDEITIYPNPTTGQLIIESSKGMNPLVIEIYDVYGRKLLEQRENLTVLQSYDLTVFPAGLYFVKIQTESGVVVKKVLKE